jgi:hypothetical protein
MCGKEGKFYEKKNKNTCSIAPFITKADIDCK